MSRKNSPKTVGIIGGGQLGRMIAQNAANLGIHTIILEPAQDAPAAQVANEHIAKQYNDKQALAKLAKKCDVVTYEFENVPSQVAEVIKKYKTKMYPPPKALKVSQNRVAEKKFLETINVKVAPWAEPKNVRMLEEKAKEFGQGILKTKTLGYDGKGQLGVSANKIPNVKRLEEYVLEKKIKFKLEFSIIAARSRDKKIVCYDPAQNIHKNGILHKSIVPAKIPKKAQQQATRIAKKIVSSLNYVGVIGIEFFLDTKNQVLVNEIAPRVHNSGHWTQEVCVTSQFEQHVRCITGMPMGSVQRYAKAEMINLIGDDIQKVNKWLRNKNAVVTMYGKKEAKVGRKMGHVTIIK